MKIAVDRTIIQGRPPLELGPQPDGSVAVAFAHDGVRLIVLLNPAEAVAIGVQCIQAAAVAKAVLDAGGPKAAAAGPPANGNGGVALL